MEKKNKGEPNFYIEVFSMGGITNQMLDKQNNSKTVNIHPISIMEDFLSFTESHSPFMYTVAVFKIYQNKEKL